MNSSQPRPPVPSLVTIMRHGLLPRDCIRRVTVTAVKHKSNECFVARPWGLGRGYIGAGGTIGMELACNLHAWQFAPSPFLARPFFSLARQPNCSF